MRNSTTRFSKTRLTPCKVLALAVAVATCLPVYAAGAEPQTAPETIVNFDIPAGDLSAALERFSTQSGIQAMYRQELVTGKRAREVNGAMVPSVALERILAGTGLSIERVNAKTYVIKPAPVRSVEPRGKVEQQDRTRSRESEDSVKELEKMVVVGSRLGTYPSDSVLPVKLITREEIDRSGAGSIAQVLSLLSEVSVSNNGDTNVGMAGAGGASLSGNGHNETNATTVQLRGLPFGSTLILINGRRAGDSSAFLRSGQFDLSTIPLSMVDRIEVLPAGSSAVYGGDGLAGVINIVLRRDVGGLEIRIRRDAAAGYGESQGSMLWGRSWSRGSLTAMVGWRENSSLWSTERTLTADQDYTRFGGRDLRAAGLGSPATVYSLAGCDLSFGFCILPLEQRGNLPGLNSPVATVPVGQNGVGLSPEDFLETDGMRGLASNEFPLVTAEQAFSTAINGSFEVTNNIEIIGELTYTRRRLPAARQEPLSIVAGEFGLPSSVVSVDNPFNPFGVDVGIDYTFRETGIYRDFSQEYWRVLVGAHGKFWQEKLDWELTAWRSEDKSSVGSVIGFDSRQFAGPLSSSDPDAAMNPFVADGSAPVSQEILASLLIPMSNGSLARTGGINGFIRGRLLTLPAGDILALVGAERQSFAYETNLGIYEQAVDLSGGDSSKALFTEARVPILSGRDQPGLEKLAMTGALRHESTSRFADDAKTKAFGIEYRPVNSALFRATYSTAFKPPTVFSVNRDVSLSSNYWVTDPLFGGEMLLVPVISGGGVSADLSPERSVSRTLGVVLSPASGWRMSITGWEVQVKDRLTSAGPQFFIEHEDEFPERVVRNPETGMINTIDIRQFNIAATSTSGVDISVEGVVSSKYGNFMPSLAATYVSKHKEKVTSLSPERNNLGVIRDGGWSPHWKVVPRVVWSYGDTYATIAARYVSSYDDPLPLLNEFGNQAHQKIGSFWMLDFNLELGVGKWLGGKSSYLSDTRLGVGAANMFNRLPDFCNYCISGYDPNQYQIMGRKIYAELRVNF